MSAASLTSRTAQPLAGSVQVPGDKSISHRALILGGLAVGETAIEGLLEGDDVLRTAAAMRAFGAEVTRKGEGSWSVWGRGVGGLAEPEDVLDMGNSGTGTRLLLGAAASHSLTATFTGDSSLRGRPMRRVTEPLSRMGAGFVGRAGGKLPLTVVGAASPMPITYEMPVASAQVKSAILLAGLNAPGETMVIEKLRSRDHTELMLQGFGADLRFETLPGGGRAITLVGQPELTGQALRVPADPSSAAFPLVAALLVPGSRIELPAVGINPQRIGLFTTLVEMGADIEFANKRDVAGEEVADLIVKASSLRGVDVPSERSPTMIDEYPILAVAAAFAEGDTRMRGLSELRVKESDRLAAIARSLAACGVSVEIIGDDLLVHGLGRAPEGGAKVAVSFDHRMAMSFLVMGMAAQAPVSVDDVASIDTSFPGFVALMNGLGARITGQEAS